jgi:multiple sugar transport system permease protein
MLGTVSVRPRSSGRLRRREAVEGWLFVAPLMLGLLVFTYGPTLASLAMSLMRWDGLTAPSFIGVDNYVTLLTRDDVYRQSLANTAYFAAGSVPLSMLFGLGMALLVNQRLPGVTLFRALFFLPVVTSSVAIGLVWAWMFSSYYGVINGILGIFGIPGLPWLGSVVWAMPAVIIVSIWYRVGYDMVLFLAGLQSIPEQLYEAAKIDGANTWQQFRHVTLPLLSPTTFFILFISVVSSFQVFNIIYVMTKGGPGYATSVYIFYLYQTAFQHFRMGYGSAMAFVLFVLLAILTAIQWKVASRWVFYR